MINMDEVPLAFDIPVNCSVEKKRNDYTPECTTGTLGTDQITFYVGPSSTYVHVRDFSAFYAYCQ